MAQLVFSSELCLPSPGVLVCGSSSRRWFSWALTGEVDPGPMSGLKAGAVGAMSTSLISTSSTSGGMLATAVAISGSATSSFSRSVTSSSSDKSSWVSGDLLLASSVDGMSDRKAGSSSLFLLLGSDCQGGS